MTRQLLSAWLALSLSVVPIGGHTLNLNFEQIGEAIKKSVSAFKEFTEPQEIEIGQGISASLLGAVPLVEDVEVQRYVNQVGHWLALHTERPGLPWTFAVIDSSSYNAFAAPGGYVFITKGLFMMLRTESELAGVLAHEMGHVLARHHLVAIQAASRRALAAEVFTEFAASQQSTLRQNKKVFAVLVNSGMSLYARGLDREDEYESDDIGVVIAARAGYEPFGLPGVLLAMDSLGSDDEGLALVNSTHPSFRSRIEHLDLTMTDRLDKYVDQQVLGERFLTVQKRLLTD